MKKYKFKFFSTYEILAEYISGISSIFYYVLWIGLISSAICLYIDFNKIVNIDLLSSWGYIWLCCLILNSIFDILYSVLPKGVLIKDNHITIRTNHPSFYTIKISHTFKISDIKCITYFDSDSNYTDRIIRKMNRRYLQEYISIKNDFLLISLKNGNKFAVSVEDNSGFADYLKSLNPDMDYVIYDKSC